MKSYKYLFRLFVDILPKDVIYMVYKYVGKKIPTYIYNLRDVKYRGTRRQKYYTRHFIYLRA